MKDNNGKNLDGETKTDGLTDGLNGAEKPQGEAKNSNAKTWFYAGVAAEVIGAVMFGLTFGALKIYGLIAAILFEMAALNFLRVQKKKSGFKLVFYFTVAAYVLLASAAAVFLGGLIYSAL